MARRCCSWPLPRSAWRRCCCCRSCPTFPRAARPTRIRRMRGGHGARGLRCRLPCAPFSCSRPATWQSPRMSSSLGRVNGFDLRFITATIGIANWIATVGALLVVLIGTRWGRTRPSRWVPSPPCSGMPRFTGVRRLRCSSRHRSRPRSRGSSCDPYLLGLCAQFDSAGRAAALAGLFSKLELASGPFLAAGLVGAGAASYAAVVNFAAGALALSALCGLAAAHLGAAAAPSDRPAVVT